MDRLHHPSGQIGRDGIPVLEFFSVERAENHAQMHHKADSGDPEKTKPTQRALWAGCKNWCFLSFSADPKYGSSFVSIHSNNSFKSSSSLLINDVFSDQSTFSMAISSG